MFPDTDQNQKNENLLETNIHLSNLRQIQFVSVFSAISNLVMCKTCHKEITFNQASPRGLGFKIAVICECGNSYINSGPEVEKALKPIYEDLSRNELLDRCKGSNTQNNNESYNGLLWHFSPKHLHNGLKTIELANFFATSIFNNGSSSVRRGLSMSKHSRTKLLVLLP
ncbi:hypothetical protein M0802_012032 [Mischocyttarus mexicanus]|nr:hypothetical protein M0802_012032 [Mischocyttarus mexicanus]